MKDGLEAINAVGKI